MASSDPSLTKEGEDTTFQLPGDAKYGRGPLVASFNNQGNRPTLLQTWSGISCSLADIHWHLPGRGRSVLFVLPPGFH